MGGVVGFISSTIFAIILVRLNEQDVGGVVKMLVMLIGIALGGGLSNYALFDLILKTNGAIEFYMVGYAILFLCFSIWAYIDWRRQLWL